LLAGGINFRPLCLETKPEGVDDSELFETVSTMPDQESLAKLTCHISGIFLIFPNTRIKTKTLHIVTKEKIVDRRLCSPTFEAVVA